MCKACYLPQCNFASDTAASNKNASAVIRRTASAARHGSEYNNAASRGSMYFDDYVDEMVEDEEDASEDDSSRSSDAFDDFNHESEPSRERVFVRVAANKSLNSSPVKQSELHHAEAQQEHKTLEQGGEGGVSGGTDSAVGDEKKEDGSNVKLETGLIDYCIILGESTSAI